MAGNRDTPAMRQYSAFKERHPECVLFFRMGDFYEMFDDDARLVHRVLGLTLTERSAGIPMAGLPYHQLDAYLRRMVEAGHRVAVCDQVQDPKEAKGVVERAVTRVITPGTLVEESLLDDHSANHLAAVAFTGDESQDAVGVAIVEVSTGAFLVFDRPASEVADELARRDVHEVLYCDVGAGDPPDRVTRLLEALGVPGTPRPAWQYRRDEALIALHEQFRVNTLAGFGLDEERDPAIPAAGVVLRYLRETQALDHDFGATSEGFSSGTAGARVVRERSLAHLAPPRREESAGVLRIDGAALRALEIERTLRSADHDGALLGIFTGVGRGGARTPMGKRLLRDWLCRPLSEKGPIEGRLNAVGVLHEDQALAKAVGESLSEVQDVARIVARVALGRATPRDLVALGGSLRAHTPLSEALDGCAPLAGIKHALDASRDALVPVASEIQRVCVDAPPAHMREGGLVRDGIDTALDEARSLQRDAGAWLAEYQRELVEEHDLPSLKVGYNKVFGYYIELPAAQARRAPAQFTRKQTLKNAERYITPELKEYEEKVLRAGESAVRREMELFGALCERVSTVIHEARNYAYTVARLDVLLAFADKARRRSWTRPEIHDDPCLDIEEARHPVLDELLGDRFVPNDCRLGPSEHEDTSTLALITGPNMAGKSTYIRQVALLTLLAHAGSFVPAQHATIGLTDRICTRIGADDALHAGQSTFMVEMVETASILHHATERTLVVLDEIGRGTSTLDGLSLAWAIVEHLGGTDGQAGPRTLFATHYHELTALSERLPGRVRNLHVSVREVGDDVVFLHRILPGHADRSYGIHVARLAGLPKGVVSRANDVMGSLTVAEAGVIDGGSVPAPSAPLNGQMGLFTEFVAHPVIEEIKGLDLNRMSPMDAFEALRKMADEISN